MSNSLHFDGAAPAPPLPQNGIPEEGTPVWERYLAAENAARAIAGAGHNAARAATLAADAAAAKATREKHGKV